VNSSLGAAAWRLAARAGDRVRRIGVLMAGVERPLSNLWYPDAAAFMQALAGLGWTDGHNMRLDVRWWGDDTNRMRALAQELVGLQPDIILTVAIPATVAVQRETRTAV